MDISVYKLKNRFQTLLMPLCKKLHSYNVTPNQITIFTLLYNIVFSYIILKVQYKWVILFVPIFFLVRMGLNALDGMIATKFSMKTNLGIFLNELGDIISDIIFFYCFFPLLKINEFYGFVFILFSIISEYVGVVSIQIDGKRHYEGPMGKSDRAVLIGLLALLPFLGVRIFFIKIIIIIGILLLILTTFNRMRNSLSNIL